MTSRYEFKFSAVLPADDPLARWIAVLAMAFNDLLLTNRLSVNPEYPEVESIYFFRLAAAHLLELSEPKGLLQAGYDDWVEVREFIATLPPDARADFDLLRELSEPNGFGKLLARARNQVFHYPHLHKKAIDTGRSEVCHALERLSPAAGYIEQGEIMSEARCLFSDDLAVELLSPHIGDVDRFMEDIRDHMLAFFSLARCALNEYFTVKYSESMKLDGVSGDA